MSEYFNPRTCIDKDCNNIDCKREKKAYQINVSFPFNFLGGDDDIFHNLKFHIWYFIFVGEKDMSLFLHCLIAKQAKYGGAIGFFYHILCFFSSDT